MNLNAQDLVNILLCINVWIFLFWNLKLTRKIKKLETEVKDFKLWSETREKP